MNDAHDNAADDRAALHHANTMLAIEAFRKQELKRLQLEMAEFALTKALRPRHDLDEYFRQTEAIRHQMELKRADYARLGKLPREEKEAVEDAYLATRAAQQAPDPGIGPFRHGYGNPA